MKKSRFTEEQIAFALRQAESGTAVEEICRKLRVSQQTFYRWKQIEGGLQPVSIGQQASNVFSARVYTVYLFDHCS